jgi:hypothetical protein
MTFSCTVDASLFARAWLATSKDPFRHYLSGVFIEPHH